MPRRSGLTLCTRPTVGSGFTAAPTVIDLGVNPSRSASSSGGNWVYQNPPYQRMTQSGMGFDLKNGNAMILGGELHVPTPIWDRVNGYGFQSNFPVQTLTVPTTATGPMSIKGGSNRATVSIADVTGLTASMIKDALESDPALGPGSVQVIAGTNAGQFRVWPAAPFSDLLGRLQIPVQPTGGGVTVAQTGNFTQTGQAGGIKNGNFVHMEGVYIHGMGLLEGTDYFSTNNNTTLQLASCYIDAPMHRFHSDFQHTDALQCYQGPSVLRMEKCTLRSTISCLMAQPLQVTITGGLTLGNWQIKDCVFILESDWWNPNRTPNSCLDDNANQVIFDQTTDPGKGQFIGTNYMVMRREVGQVLPGGATVTRANKYYTSGSPNLGPRVQQPYGPDLPSGGVPIVRVPVFRAIPPAPAVVVIEDKDWVRPDNTVGCDPAAGEAGVTYDVSYP